MTSRQHLADIGLGLSTGFSLTYATYVACTGDAEGAAKLVEFGQQLVSHTPGIAAFVAGGYALGGIVDLFKVGLQRGQQKEAPYHQKIPRLIV